MQRLFSRWAPWFVGLVAFVLYYFTLAPSIVIGDSPELTTAAYTLGVAHPTGYPLYTLLGFVVTHLLPFGDPAFRMNLFSAACGAAACGIFALIGRRMGCKTLPSVLGSLLLASSFELWSTSLSAEVYSLHLVFVSLLILFALEWRRTGHVRWLQRFAFCYGLALTHHMSVALLFPAFAVFLFASRRKSTVPWLKLGLLFVLPLLLYAYLPLAALHDAQANWGDVRTPERLYWHLSGAFFKRFMHLPTARDLARDLPSIVPFGWPVVVVAAAGVLSMVRSRVRRPHLVLLAALSAIIVAFTLAYGIPDHNAYFIPVHLGACLCFARGLRWMGSASVLRSRLRPLLAVAASGYLLIMTAATYPAIDASGTRTELVRSQRILSQVGQNAILILPGYQYGPLVYQQECLGARKDVALLYADALYYKPWVRLITRFRAKGVKVELPECFLNNPRHLHPDDCLREAIVHDNPDRPVVDLDR